MKVSALKVAILNWWLVGLIFPAVAQPGGLVVSPAVYVPDYAHANDPLPANVLAWDATSKSVEATNGQDFAWFAFAFTNVAVKADTSLTTNVMYTTNFTTVTNRSFWDVFSGRKYASEPSVAAATNVVTVTNSLEPDSVAILSAHASCGCTQPQLPPLPWVLPPGTNGSIRVSVNLAGKSGSLFKTVSVTTDKGRLDLMLRVNIAAPPPPRMLSASERAQGIAAAKIDRQAVFRGDCASCHAKDVAGKYGPVLFAQVCAVCHEANPRATMVPDLHHLKDPTSDEFWRAWITSGKAGTLMPAFSTAQGGPLDDMQIASLAAYLNKIIPPTPAPPPQAAGR